jgi:glycosyltransferase involved in cell wall biosynthesis
VIAGGDRARVAVLVPCFNDPLVLDAVTSIDESEPVEVAVVDDASTEPAALAALDELRRRGVNVIRHAQNRGLAQSRMSALHATQAPYVYPLDADDLAVPGILAQMADRLDAEPGLDLCLGDYAEFGDSNAIIAVPERLDPYRLLYTHEYGPSLFRREPLVAVGGWAQPGHVGLAYEDWHLLMSLVERGARAGHMGPGVIVYRRRLHGGRMLSAARKRHRAIYRSLRRAHPQLFAARRAHRRASDLSRARKVLYPIVYGGRPRFAFELKIRFWLDRLGVWTLRR